MDGGHAARRDLVVERVASHDAQRSTFSRHHRESSIPGSFGERRISSAYRRNETPLERGTGRRLALRRPDRVSTAFRPHFDRGFEGGVQRRRPSF
ncbi:hypothetical protein AKJ09_01906 [Labilithrix luteola]|uniref:Uncharacterized protein n=1 Tax=Labilithrix luteola TaxID=1391654 RepID=A0A0K1PP10_9BACT|nr:hypothetical protein AKJ09_01906 [Labilithrix luteola]